MFNFSGDLVAAGAHLTCYGRNSESVNPHLRAQIKLGRIAGIPIGLHYSWFLIVLLMTLSLAQHFHDTTRQWSEPVVWITAIGTGLLFFAALLLHELAHSLVARAHGMRVRSITLFALGGLTRADDILPNRLEHDPFPTGGAAGKASDLPKMLDCVL